VGGIVAAIKTGPSVDAPGRGNIPKEHSLVL
jgi:hypothetical protein